MKSQSISQYFSHEGSVSPSPKQSLKGVSISRLSLLENQRMLTKSERLMSLKTETKLSNSTIPHLPSKGDFNKILNGLDEVISKKHFAYKTVVLNEGEPLDFILSMHDTQYFKVICKGKPCPLKIKLARDRGQVISYISRKNQEPSGISHDFKTKNDSFEISDFGLKFTSECVYIGLFALVNSSFTVSISFGRTVKRITKNRINMNSVQNIAIVKDTPKAKEQKNIIKRNKKVALLNSLACKDKHLKNNMLWEERRKNVLEKKKKLILDKQATYKMKMKNEHDLYRKQEVVSFQKSFFQLLFAVKFVDSLWTRGNSTVFQHLNLDRFNRNTNYLLYVRNVVKIQRAWRRYLLIQTQRKKKIHLMWNWTVEKYFGYLAGTAEIEKDAIIKQYIDRKKMKVRQIIRESLLYGIEREINSALMVPTEKEIFRMIQKYQKK